MMQEAMNLYQHDWRSSGDTGPHYWKSWVDLHTAHWGGVRRPALPLLPLTAQKVHAVGALLKVAGYRGTKNYINIARQHHAEESHPWTPALDLAIKRFVASTLRGIGPPRQREPLTKLSCSWTCRWMYL